MAEVVISYAIGVLGKAAIQEIALRCGVDDELKWLESELRFMKACIQDAEDKRHSFLVRQWLHDIKELSEEARKELEDFNQARSSMDSIIHPFKKRNFANQIKSFKQRLGYLGERRQLYGIQHNGEEVSNVVVRTGSIRDQEDLIGFEDIATTLRDELLNGESSRKVVSIFGMGGLGKTALVKKLYHSLNGFECRAWVQVKQNYQPNSLVPLVISSLMAKMTPEEVIMAKFFDQSDPERFLRNLLESRRYLVVVDDVWDFKAWDELERAFPCNNRHSRVIVTTRKKTVGERAATETSVHKLRFLTLEESNNLFRRELREDNPVTEDMISLAETMVNKCGGLPLAITLLGKMLKADNDLATWRQVREDVWGHLMIYMKKIHSEEISNLFTLSYDDLAGDEQKPLFLYMGMFPSGHEVDRNKLISMWITEPHDTNTTSDTYIQAVEYFNMLIDNSFIVQEGSFWGKPTTCKVVHDLVRYLIIQKAEKVGYFHIFPPPNYNCGKVAKMSSIRHAIHDQANEYVTSSTLKEADINLHALLFFNTTASASSLADQCAKFKRLKILDLTGIDFSSAQEQLSKMLRKITSLKFLVLADTLISIVPYYIYKQRDLQFLDTGTSSLWEIRMEIQQLDRLRHLHGFFHSTLYLPIATDLRSVRLLSYPTPEVDMETNLLQDIVSKKQLQELSLRCKPCDSLIFITQIQNLVTLIISSCVSDPGNDLSYVNLPAIEALSSCQQLSNLWLDGPLVSLPKWDKFPRYMQRLILSRSQLTGNPMTTLEMLPNLNSLELMNAYDGDNLVCSSSKFLVLKYLRLFEAKNLRIWEVQEGAMPRMQGLTISECPRLILPQRFQDFPNAGKTKSMYGVPQYTNYIPPQPQV